MATPILASPPVSAASYNGQNYQRALVVLTALFFMWGFITVLNDLLIPHLKASFKLTYTQVMLVQFCFFGAYFVFSIPSSNFLKKVGYKSGIIAGLAIMGVACLAFYPAAANQSFAAFLTALFVLGGGITLLQVAANPYVAVLGPPETASSRLNLSQAFNSLGTFLAPLFGAQLILQENQDVASVNIESVQIPYIGIAATLLLLAAIVFVTKLPSVDEEQVLAEGHDTQLKTSAFQFPYLVLGAIAIFLYVGAEVSIGSFLHSMLTSKDYTALPIVTAGQWISAYWGGAMVGRFIGAAALQRIRPAYYLAANAGIAAALCIMASVFTGQTVMAGILAIGFFNATMFPSIFTMALDGLGRYTRQGSGILCMAIVGGAIIPLMQGRLADIVGLQLAFLLPAVCYGYIVWFGLHGCKSGRDESYAK